MNLTKNETMIINDFINYAIDALAFRNSQGYCSKHFAHILTQNCRICRNNDRQ